MRDINKIILHCSDSNYPQHDNISVIRKWHMQERKWNDVGYHYFIRSTGEIQQGRLLATQGAHCYGKNKDSIGICLSGKDKFTTEQFASLKRLLLALKDEFKIDSDNIRGHCFYTKSKTCPNFDVDNYKKEYGL